MTYIEEVKLIDYGSSFSYGNLRNFTMATPEYMAPEVLNFTLHLTKHPQTNIELLRYANSAEGFETYPHAIDMWSLGCVCLEIITGIPLWMAQEMKV